MADLRLLKSDSNIEFIVDEDIFEHLKCKKIKASKRGKNIYGVISPNTLLHRFIMDAKEGDIVKIFHVSGTMQGKYFFDVVEWNDLRCRFDTENYGMINDDDVYEVIGNIYENPELLKE